MNFKLPKNKWFYAFAIATVLAIAAIVVAIVVGVTSAKTPEYNEGDEIGVYYYDVKDGEMLLTLSGGNKFTLTGPNTNKTGTYTVDGATITLDFIKDEDGTTTATIVGDKLTLTYDNATMPMLKKVNYTVSFNVNGGSEIAAVTVVNGKTVSKPADPAKENNVFLGWYADEALTTPFGFDTVVVKADMTVYAKWAAKTAGVADYTVSFDLGYDGAEAIAPIVTVSGKAYGVTAPEREGFTFGGWWISASDDAAKLTYAYTDSTVFTADTTLFAVWYDNASTKLNAPAVSVTANAITWNAVAGAVSYKLTVVAPNGTVVVDNKTVAATTETFDFAAGAAGEYVVYVVAVSADEAKNSDAATRYYNNKTLDRVTDFQVVNGWLVFGTVANAEKYVITVDCGNDAHVHTAFDNGKSTVFNLTNCPMQKGGILVTVTAVAEGYASSTSKVFAYDLTLGKVDYIVYQPENDAVVWGAVENAVAYVVTVTVGDKTYTFNTGAETKFSTAGFTGNFTVAVAPATEGYNSPEAATVACAKTAPAAPEGVRVNGMIISWNAVEGATAYEVKIGDQTVTVNTTTLNLAENGNVVLNQSQYYAITVKAVNAANEVSSASAAVNMGYFVMNPTLTYNKNTVYWTPVLGVTKYQVRVNGGEVKTVENASSLKVTLTKAGDNLIEVRYVYGETASDWATVNVTAYEVEYDTRTGKYGVLANEYLAVGDVMTLPIPEENDVNFFIDGYYFSGWYNAPKGAEGNGKMYAEGATFNGNAYTVVYAEWAPKTYEITLNTNGYVITNFESGKKEPATYTKNYTLSVPVTNNPDRDVFMGWYEGPQGAGKRYTDEYGVSLEPYKLTRDLTLYPYFSNDALEFVLQDDDTYAVKKGPNIDSITNLIVPVTYNDKPVTVILESAFSSCKNLKTISIPDTIKLVGAKALDTCTALERIDIYEAYPGKVYEKIYSSDNGVLIREDTGVTYLEFVPRAMTGEYTVPSNVDKILTKAFYYTGVEKVIIPDNVQTLPKYAFYYCKSLATVEISGNRTTPITIESDAFYTCNALTTLNLPNNIDAEFKVLKATLDVLTSLKSINVEDGGQNYGSVGGMLTNKEKDTILYCPYGYTGPVSIPKNVKAVADNAFYRRSGITSVFVPFWVTSIGSQAFDSCYNLQTVTFEGGRYEDLVIGENAFAFTYALESVTFKGNGNFGDEGSKALDNGAVTIGNQAFYSSSIKGNYNLHTVTVEAGVKIASIGKNAFQYCGALANFNVDKNAYVGTIGERAFYGCNKLTEFTVHSTTSSIGKEAFLECKNLAVVNFEQGDVTLTLADYSFRDCLKLASITIPDRLSNFNSVAFEGCESLKEIKVGESDKYKNDENGILYRYEKVTQGTEEVEVLTELLFYPVGLVKEKGGVINDLPATIVTIGGAAFANNKYLEEITIPKSVTSIGTSAFENCINLEKVNFATAAAGETLTIAIGNAAFSHCESLANIDLPSYTTKIGQHAFNGSGLVSIVIPEDVTEIGYGAFAWCQSLVSVEFNCKNTLKLEAGSAHSQTGKAGIFDYCLALEEITLPASVTEIPAYTFYYCTSLERVNLTPVVEGEGAEQKTYYNLKTIGTYAFRYCYALEEIFIPKSVTTIGNGAFEGASDTNHGNLTNVNFELGGTEALTIGTSVFKYQPYLTKITFPARLAKIANANKDGGMTATNLATTSLTIEGIFANCYDFAEINVAVEDGITGYFTSLDGVLYNADKTVLLYCPAANVGRYVEGVPTYELVIPKTVTVVATKAIYQTTVLKTVTFEEFEKTDANYGKQLLTIGNYKSTSTSTTATSSYYNYAAIGGKTSSVETISLPSHLKAIGTCAFGVQDADTDHPVTLTINPDAKNIELAREAFLRCKATSISITSVSSMAIYAFANSKYLESVNIGIVASKTDLADYMFYNCKALTSFTIPDHITKINTYAFSNCTSLANVNMPSKVVTLGKYCFQSTAITSVTIPKTVTNSGISTGCVFYSCSALTTVTIEEGSPLTKIPESMFYNCLALENLDLSAIAANVTEIGKTAFRGTEAITSFDFSQFTKLTTLGNQAFSFGGLVHADLTNTKITQLTTAFNNTSYLKTLKLPTTVNTIASAAFTNCTAMEKLTITNPGINAAMLLIISGLDFEVELPKNLTNFVIDEYGVFYDPAYQTIYFAGFSDDLTGYTIPQTVMNIYDKAFQYAKMDKLEIPESVTAIGKEAFAYADIPHIVFHPGVSTIGQKAFQYATLAKVEFENEHQSKLTTIDSFAFAYTNLTEFVMPDSVTTVGVSLFLECYDLKRVVFSAGIKILGQSATQSNVVGKCTSLEEIVFQEGLEQIPYLFTSTSENNEYSNNVTTVTIPSTVKGLGGAAFRYFTNLETIVFAEGSQLETVGEKAFYGCYSLENIELPATVNTIGKEAFQNCRALPSLDLEKTAVTDVLKNTFTGTESLGELKLPAGLVTIEEQAFYKAGIENIYIPGTVTTIGISAFEDCTSLKTVTFSTSSMMTAIGDIETDTNIFRGTTALETVTLPNFMKTIGNRVFENSGVKYVNLTDDTAEAELEVVGNYAFYNCARLESFALLENLKNVGNYAFFNCGNLEAGTADDFKADLEGLTEMGAMAFGFCTKLPVGYIPSSLTLLGGNPYAGLDKTQIVIAEGNKSVVAETDSDGVLNLYDADGITLYGVYGATGEYVFDSTVNHFGDGVVAGNAITSVTVPARLGNIPGSAFMNCSTLSSVTIEPGITSIGDYAFHATAISAITIPASVTSVGDYAFANCDSLNNVYIPKSVTKLGRYCFAYCDTLSEFEFEETTSAQALGDHFFYYCTSLTEVVLPSKVAITKEEAKRYGITVTTTQANVMPGYMFAGTGIVNATIPESVGYYFTDGVFADCKNLEKVYLDSDLSSSSYDKNPSMFAGCDKFQGFWVPKISGGMLYVVEYATELGVPAVHFMTLEGAQPLGTYTRTEYAGADLKVYFDDATYQELVEYFNTVARVWKCQVYDKDGNQLFCSENSGKIGYVQDKNGNVIWTATAEN